MQTKRLTERSRQFYELTEAERKEKKRLRQANGNAYINLQLSCEELPFCQGETSRKTTFLEGRYKGE